MSKRIYTISDKRIWALQKKSRNPKSGITWIEGMDRKEIDKYKPTLLSLWNLGDFRYWKRGDSYIFIKNDAGLSIKIWCVSKTCWDEYFLSYL